MTPDPMTDEEAAKAFTKEHGLRGASATINWHTPQHGQPQCAGKVWGDWRSHQCTKRGRIALADGTMWCGIHAPAAVAARKAKRDASWAAYQAKWNASAAAEKRQRAKSAAFEVFLVALQKIEAGANDAREVAREALAAYDPR